MSRKEPVHIPAPRLSELQALPMEQVKAIARRLGIDEKYLRYLKGDREGAAVRMVLAYMKWVWLKKWETEMPRDFDRPMHYTLNDFDTPEHMENLRRIMDRGGLTRKLPARSAFFARFHYDTVNNQIAKGAMYDEMEKAGLTDAYLAGQLKAAIDKSDGKDKVTGIKLAVQLKEATRGRIQGQQEDYSQYLPGGAPQIEDGRFEDVALPAVPDYEEAFLDEDEDE